ncbi:MAG: hypothetical protein R2856_12985 [Caldilineaceae bacterium]
MARNKSIAIMGAWGADIVHDVNREVSRIRDTILKIKLKYRLDSDLSAELDIVDRVADAMQLPKLPMLGSHDSSDTDYASNISVLMLWSPQKSKISRPGEYRIHNSKPITISAAWI